MPYKIEIRNDLDVDYCDKWVRRVKLFARKSKSKKHGKNSNSIIPTNSGSEKSRRHRLRCIAFYLRLPFSSAVSESGMKLPKLTLLWRITETQSLIFKRH